MPAWIKDIPVADIDLGGFEYIRLYAYNDIEPRLVEMRTHYHGANGTWRMTVAQARAIAAAFTAAADRAEREKAEAE